MYCCTPKVLYNHVGGVSPQPPPVVMWCSMLYSLFCMPAVDKHHTIICLAVPCSSRTKPVEYQTKGFYFSHFIPTCVLKQWHDTLFPHEHQALFHLGLFTLSLERERFPDRLHLALSVSHLPDTDPVDKYTEETLTFTHIHLHRVKNMHVQFLT